MWQYSKRSDKLRTDLILSITKKEHIALNEWIDNTIGYIPPIPPQELVKVCELLNGQTANPPLKIRIQNLINAIQTVANASQNYSVKTILNLTCYNLEQQARYLDARGLLNPKPIQSVPPPLAIVAPFPTLDLYSLCISCKRKIKRHNVPKHHNKRLLRDLYREYDITIDASSALYDYQYAKRA